jgi:hypothetical protein
MFASLPNDTRCLILQYLDAQSIWASSNVDRQLHVITQSPNTWRFAIVNMNKVPANVNVSLVRRVTMDHISVVLNRLMMGHLPRVERLGTAVRIVGPGEFDPKQSLSHRLVPALMSTWCPRLVHLNLRLIAGIEFKLVMYPSPYLRSLTLLSNVDRSSMGLTLTELHNLFPNLEHLVCSVGPEFLLRSSGDDHSSELGLTSLTMYPDWEGYRPTWSWTEVAQRVPNIKRLSHVPYLHVTRSVVGLDSFKELVELKLTNVPEWTEVQLGELTCLATLRELCVEPMMGGQRVLDVRFDGEGSAGQLSTQAGSSQRACVG